MERMYQIEWQDAKDGSQNQVARYRNLMGGPLLTLDELMTFNINEQFIYVGSTKINVQAALDLMTHPAFARKEA